MAGDWVVWTKGLSRKREVIAIANATGRSRRDVAATLMEFWEWADSESIDGLLCGVFVRNLSACVADTNEEFWRHVVSVGWLIESSDGTVLPRFSRWMGKSAKRRLQESQRKAESRIVLGKQPEIVSASCPQDLPEMSAEMSASDADEKRPIEQKSKRNKKTPLPPIPESLDTPEFQDAWQVWLAYRREKGKTVYSIGAGRALKKLAEMGPERAVACIEHTIFKNWDGLVEPRSDDRNGRHQFTLDDFMKGFQGDQPVEGERL